MKKSLGVAALVLIVAGSCGRSDLSVTETGNPVKVSLSYKTITSTNSLFKVSHKNDTQSVIVTRVVLVIDAVSLESSTGVDSLSFESEIPYLLDLDLSGSTVLLDSLMVTRGGLYDEIEFKIEPLEDSILLTRHPCLADKSIRIEGYCNGDSMQPFVFESDLDAELSRSIDPPVDLSDRSSHNVVLRIDVSSWFLDSEGGILDPRLEVNRDEIEDNIEESFDAFEEG